MRRIERLPEPAGSMWRRMRAGVEESIRKRISDFRGWQLSGGTVLAAQWHHRKSTDVDLKVPAKTGLALLDPRYDPGFDREMKALGAGQPIHRQDQIIIPVGEAKIDIFEGTATPLVGEEEIEIDGQPEMVLSNAQILTGKIKGKGLDSPTRDLYDIAVAVELDPRALEAAVNSIPDGTWGETVTRWKETAASHAMLAAKSLAGVPQRWRAIADDPASAAAERSATARYTEVRIRVENDEVEVSTRCTGRDELIERIDGSTRASAGKQLDRRGITAYLDTLPGTTASEILDEIDAKRGRGATTIYDSRQRPGARTRTSSRGARQPTEGPRGGSQAAELQPGGNPDLKPSPPRPAPIRRPQSKGT